MHTIPLIYTPSILVYRKHISAEAVLDKRSGAYKITNIFSNIIKSTTHLHLYFNTQVKLIRLLLYNSIVQFITEE